MTSQIRRTRSISTHALAALLLAFTLTHSRAAHAGPVEQFVQLALHPANPDVLVLRYAEGGGGIFYSSDRGASWALRCTSGIEPGLISLLSVGVAGDGSVMATGSLGGSEDYAKSLWQDDAKGCGFTRVDALKNIWLSDIEPHPTDPDVVFGVASGLDKGRLNGLWKRDKGGEWSEVGPRERIMISSLRIVKTANGLRMYESALRELPAADAGTDAGAAPTYGFVIRVSDDEGETWEEFPYGMVAREASLRLEAVDPMHPDTIVVSLGIVESMGVPSKETQDLVLVSDDRGETFHTYQTISEIGGVVFTPDGALWIGEVGSIFDASASRGLWTATSLDAPAKKLGDMATQCLAYQPASDTLYACQRQTMGSVDRKTGEVTMLLRAVSAKSMSSCAGEDTPAACEMQLCLAYCGGGHFAQAPLCQAYDTPTCGPSVAIQEGTGDAGVMMSSGGAGKSTAGSGGTGSGGAAGGANAGSGAADAGAKPSDKGSDSGCGCAVPGGHRTSGTAWAWILAGLVVTMKRLRRGRTGRSAIVSG